MKIFKQNYDALEGQEKEDFLKAQRLLMKQFSHHLLMV